MMVSIIWKTQPLDGVVIRSTIFDYQGNYYLTGSRGGLADGAFIMKIEQSGNILFQRGFGTNVGSVTNNVFDYPRHG